MLDLNKVMTGGKWVLTPAYAVGGPANTKLTAGCIVGVGTLSGKPTAWIATPKWPNLNVGSNRIGGEEANWAANRK